VPAIAFAPEDAAASQSDGQVIDARTVPLSAAAQFAGADPDRISKVGAVEIAVSIASSRAFLTVVDN